MGKALKIIGICLGAFILFMVLAVGLGPYVIPWGSMITDAVEDATGRKASVEQVSVSLIGGLEVEIKGLVVQDLPAYGARPLLKLDSLHIQVSLTPLLASKMVVEKTLIQGLEVSLVKDKQGRLNWRDMPARSDEKVEVEVEEPDFVDDGTLIVTSAQVLGSKIFLHNLATGKSGVLPLNKMDLNSDLSAGGASGGLSLDLTGFKLQASASSQGYDQDLKVKDLQVDLDIQLAPLAQVLSVLRPGLKASGSLGFKLRAQGPLSAVAIKASGLAQALKLSGPATGGKEFSLPRARLLANLTLDWPGKLVQIRELKLISKAAGLISRLQGRLGWEESLGQSDATYHQEAELDKLFTVLSPLLPMPLKAQGVASKDVRFRGAGKGAMEIVGKSRAMGVVVSTPALPQPFREPKFLADFRILIEDEGDEIELTRMNITSRAARLGITGKMKRDHGKLEAKLDIKGDYLNFNRLPMVQMHQAKQAQRKARAAAQAKASAKPVKAAEGQAAGIDPAAGIRKALAGKKLEAKLKLAKVVFKSYNIKALRAELEIKDQKIELDDVSCKVLGGGLDLEAEMDFAQAKPASQFQAKGENLKVTPQLFRSLQDDFFLFALPLSSLSGVFSLETELQGKGLGSGQLFSSLKGKGELKARDEVTVGLDFLENMPGGGMLWEQVLRHIPRRFAKMQGEYTIGNGRVNYDLLLKDANKEVDLEIVGSTGLLDHTVDAQLKISGKALGRDLRRVLAPDGTFPIMLGGTLDKLEPKVDLPGGGLAPVQNLLQQLFNR
jgi:uncharacterized protein involved in outer membrane biogenesis